jgi:hypothetical protein
MKVYLLESDHGYEGSYNISIHASEQSAREAALEYMRENPDWDYIISPEDWGCFAHSLERDMFLSIKEFELRY